MKKGTIVIGGLLIVIIGGGLLGVLIWWLVRTEDQLTVTVLDGDGVGDVSQFAGFTNIPRVGSVFWWFYPTLSNATVNRPILLWLDGVTGLPPSLLANFGMFGPYDINLNRREDSWINEYSLLFVDAPIGTGFSTVNRRDGIPSNLEENADHLLHTLEGFFNTNEAYQTAPLYIFGQGHGAQLGLALASRLHQADFNHNLKGVVIGNGIIYPSMALTKLGFYLEEMGYIDGRGRNEVEEFATETHSLVQNSQYNQAFDLFMSLGDFMNEKAGCVAVNLGRITDKLTNNSLDYFNQKMQLSTAFADVDFNEFMESTVAPKLGISNALYDSQRDDATSALRSSFMIPAVELVEHILQDTGISVSIYNGNLDAVSNTPGQLEWISTLQWSEQDNFTATPRQTLIVDGLVQGYFKETERLKFYWVNAAGQSVPLDSPDATRRILQRITN